MFFLILFGVYGAMNLYLLGKVWVVFPGLGKLRFAAAALTALMVAGPVLVHYLDRRRDMLATDVLADLVYVWMAVVFWFTCLMLLADAWNLLTWSIGALAAPVRSAMLPGKATLAVIGAILVIATGTGLWEAQNIRLRHVTLHVPSLPGGRQELRIVQLADLHLGVHVGPFRLDRIVQRVQEARPDLLVSTGDLIDSPLSHAMPMAATLATLQAPMGKFAIFGNHEFYVGVDPSLEFHRLAGFEVLRQKAVLFGTELMLVGVDDSGTHFDHQGMSDENAVLPPREHRPVTLLLKHQPVVRPESLGRFDLQLSGHTHGGQVFPFGLLTARIYPLGFGWHDLGEGSKLYVSNGAGTWGPPIRLFAPPEVTLITLTTRAVQSGPTDE